MRANYDSDGRASDDPEFLCGMSKEVIDKLRAPQLGGLGDAQDMIPTLIVLGIVLYIVSEVFKE